MASFIEMSIWGNSKELEKFIKQDRYWGDKDKKEYKSLVNVDNILFISYDKIVKTANGAMIDIFGIYMIDGIIVYTDLPLENIHERMNIKDKCFKLQEE